VQAVAQTTPTDTAAPSPPRGECRASGRGARGRFAAGNPYGEPTRFRSGQPGPALRHGGRASGLQQQLLDQAQAFVSEKRGEIEADRGGPEHLSRVSRDLIIRYVETSTIADWLGSNIVRFGALTGKGRQRAALSAYLQVLDRQLRLAQAIGLERRTKRVPTLDEWTAQLADVDAEPDPLDVASDAAGDTTAALTGAQVDDITDLAPEPAVAPSPSIVTDLSGENATNALDAPDRTTEPLTPERAATEGID
jgi:hypothetical protein